MNPLMILGTSSGCGKSLMTAAICRHLLRKGHQPIPFKGQNMSNNAWVDKYGGEMAYSQVVQSWASELEPISAMNPVLLKPKGDETSEVIHLGKSVGTTKAASYYENWFDSGWLAIKKGLKILEEKHKNGVLVLEGAGSPVEVNLQHRDLTNLKLATYLKANCILVSDIERGGVFAQIVGTLSLMKPHERALIKGIIINRFRGNISLFDSGKEWIESKTGIPVLGIMPWLDQLFPAEDSLDLINRNKSTNYGEIEISVIKLPSISNFSDIDPLEDEETVNINWVSKPGKIGNPDLLIIPGSKQTIKDLEFLKKTGIFKEIKGYAKAGGNIFGICGGMQILGRTLEDQKNIEGSITSNSSLPIEGLNLIPIKTTFNNAKRLSQQNIDTLWPETMNVSGFEIHHGDSRPLKESDKKFFEFSTTHNLGWVVSGDRSNFIAGCYLHGIFDNGEWRRVFLNKLRANNGFSSLETKIENYNYMRNKVLDKLTDNFENNINIGRIF